MNSFAQIKNKFTFLSIIILLLIGLAYSNSDTPKKITSLPKPEIKKNNWKAPLQEKARLKSLENIDLIINIHKENPSERKNRLFNKKFSKKNIEPYFLLNSPIIKKSNDNYLPVRFMHRRHAGSVENCNHSSHEAQPKDCTTCHHHRSADMTKKEITRCSACHQDSFNSKIPGRVGLKAAYHLKCMGCHQEVKQGPTGCIGCHAKKTPDHSKLVKLTGKETPTQVTQECLRCHEEQGKDMLKTVHWNWKGPSPFTEGHEKRIDSGKATNVVNNY